MVFDDEDVKRRSLPGRGHRDKNSASVSAGWQARTLAPLRASAGGFDGRPLLGLRRVVRAVPRADSGDPPLAVEARALEVVRRECVGLGLLHGTRDTDATLLMKRDVRELVGKLRRDDRLPRLDGPAPRRPQRANGKHDGGGNARAAADTGRRQTLSVHDDRDGVSIADVVAGDTEEPREDRGDLGIPRRPDGDGAGEAERTRPTGDRQQAGLRDGGGASADAHREDRHHDESSAVLGRSSARH